MNIPDRLRLFWPKLFRVLTALGLSLSISNAAQERSASPDNAGITVYVTAIHKNNSATDLTASDLTLTVDKQPAQITNVRPARDEPLLFALLVDVSRSDSENANAIRRNGIKIFQALSAGENQGYLVLFNQNVAISQTPLSLSRVETNLNGVIFGGATALYDAIVQTCEQVFHKSAKNARRVIVVLSDGGDNQSRNSHIEAASAAQRENVSVFSLLLPGPHAKLSAPRLEHVRDISRATGGRVVESEMINSVPALLAEIREQWSVTFTPAKELKAKMHPLQVKSKNKDIEVSAPAEFLSPQ